MTKAKNRLSKKEDNCKGDKMKVKKPVNKKSVRISCCTGIPEGPARVAIHRANWPALERKLVCVEDELSSFREDTMEMEKIEKGLWEKLERAKSQMELFHKLMEEVQNKMDAVKVK